MVAGSGSSNHPATNSHNSSSSSTSLLNSSSARNIAIKVNFMKGEEEHCALPVLFAKSSSSLEYCKEVFVNVVYHNKTPQYHDEVKIKLPAILADNNYHLLFTFYHISCQSSKDQNQLETVIGYSWLPLQQQFQYETTLHFVNPAANTNLNGANTLPSNHGDLDYFLTVNTYGQQGYRDNSKQSADRVTGNVGYRISDNVETRFYAGYVSNDSQLPSTLTKDELQNSPKKSKINNFGVNQGINQRNVDIWRIANKTTFQWEKTQLELGAFYSYKDLFHPIIDLGAFSAFAPTLGVIDQKTDDYGLYAKLNHQGKLFGLDNDLIIGASPTYGKTDDKRFRNENASRGALTNSFDLTAYNYETYAENRLHLTPEMTAIAGLQYTYSKRKATDKLITLTGDESFNRSYSQLNPKLGAIYQLNPTAQVFANVSRSFEPPSFGELVNTPTPEPLKAQDGVTYEIGTRGNSENIDWDVSVYHARLNNELLQVSTFPQYFGTTVNANRTQQEAILAA